jgi:hypothetical protein
MPLIFISHAEADKLVVDDLFDLLQMGCDIRREEIVCTSVDGAGIRTGEDFVKWVHQNIQTSALVILFITPNYFASRFCTAEMGAAWALEKDIFPMVIPSIERDAGGVMLGKQTAVVDESGLDHLRDRIATYYAPAAQSTPRWSVKREEFLKKFRSKLPSLPVPPVVDRSHLEREKERTVAAMQISHQVEEENKVLREQLALMEKAKDRAEVEKIKMKFIPEQEHYSALVKKVNQKLNNLSPIEVRCIFSSIRDELWEPSQDCSREYGTLIEKAKQSEWIIESGFDDSLKPNRNHPRLRSVFEAIEELDRFITNELSPDAIATMQDQNEYIMDVKNRQYWEEALYQRPMWD